MQLRIIVSLILLLLTSLASANNLTFNKLSREDGLQVNATKYVTQDHKGYIWVATSTGASRYDGLHFKNYSYDKDQPDSIPAGTVHRLLSDHRDSMWFAIVKNGLAKYLPATDSFVHFTTEQNLTNNTVTDMIADGDYIWVTTRSGLNRINSKTHEIKNFFFQPSQTLDQQQLAKVNDFYSVVKIGNWLLLKSSHQLLWFDLTKQQFDANPVENNIATGLTINMHFLNLILIKQFYSVFYKFLSVYFFYLLVFTN